MFSHLKCNQVFYFTSATYAVDIGAGGAGGVSTPGLGSAIGTIVSAAGGGIGGHNAGAGGNGNIGGSGGSGGGEGYSNAYGQGFSLVAGVGGNNGGRAGSGGGTASGGGGGAGAAGGNGSGTTGGNGGNGLDISAWLGQSPSSTIKGGGGAGAGSGVNGTAGTGGGGAADNNGTANSGGGAGAGIKDMFAQRLEALQEGLQTEAETVQAWYDDGLTTLQTAVEQKMLTEEEYRALRERLEQEHQERLGSIREMGNKWGVEAALSGGAEILNAVGQTNKKALRMAKVFSAAEALISTYKGAAKEMEKGTLGFATAAAVIAKGISFVAAIRGVSESGSGSAGGGSSAAGAVASGGGTTETRTANINFYGGFQPTQETIGMIASGLNDWLGDGGRLNMRTA